MNTKNKSGILIYKIVIGISLAIILYYQYSYFTMSKNLKGLISYGDMMLVFAPLFLISIFGLIFGVICLKLLLARKDTFLGSVLGGNETEIILWGIMTIVSLLIVLYYKLSFGSIYQLNSLLLNITAGTSIIGICGWIYISVED